MARLTKTSSKASKTRAREAIRAKGRKTFKPGKAERAITPAAKPRAGRSVTELKAQLVLRTNHRVPGSSPGAPTIPFKRLA